MRILPVRLTMIAIPVAGGLVLGPFGAGADDPSRPDRDYRAWWIALAALALAGVLVAGGRPGRRGTEE